MTGSARRLPGRRLAACRRLWSLLLAGGLLGLAAACSRAPRPQWEWSPARGESALAASNAASWLLETGQWKTDRPVRGLSAAGDFLVAVDGVGGRLARMTVTAGGASEPRWLPAGGPLLPVVATDGRRRAWAVDRGGRILVAVDLLGVPGSLERSLPADLDLRRVRALLFHPTAGLLWAADVGRHRLLLLRAGASVALVRSVGGRGRGPGEFNYPVDLALAPDGDVWVLDALNHRLQRFGPGGDLRNALPPDPEALVRPTALVIDPAGRPWVFEASRGVLLGYDTDGRPLLDAEGHRVRIDAGPGCSDMATTPDGRLWLADPLSGLVRVFEWVDGSGDGVSSRGSAS